MLILRNQTWYHASCYDMPVWIHRPGSYAGTTHVANIWVLARDPVLGSLDRYSTGFCKLISDSRRQEMSHVKWDFKGYKISPEICMFSPKAMSAYLYLLLSFRIWNYHLCPCFIFIDIWPFEGCFGCQCSQKSVLKGFRSRIWENKGILECHFFLGSHCRLWDRNFRCNVGANIIFFMSKDLLIKC